MKLALLQMEVLEKNKAGNVEKACHLLKHAAPQADIAVLPEIWTTGYSLGHLSKEAEYLNGPVIEEIRSIAAANSCAVVAGSIPLRKGDGNVTFVTELQQDGSVKMTISDQGPGIPEEDLPFIWERFYKVDKSHSRNVPGTGLGLAIAREIIRMHGAKVQVFSKLGEGTRFEITFPKDKVISE